MKLLDHKKLGKLILDSRNGDHDAFQEFYNNTAPVQYYQILQMVKNPAEASDALQETYLLLYKNLNQIREPSTVIAYLNKLSYYTCKNLIRVTANREHRQANLEDASHLSVPEADPQEVILKSDDSSRIRKAIMELPADEKLVLTMRYLQKLTLRETAAAMGISYAKVQRLQKAAKEHLRNVLNKKGLLILLPIAPELTKELGGMVPDPGNIPELSQTTDTATLKPAPKIAVSPPSPALTSILAKGALIAAGAGITGSIVTSQVISAPIVKEVEQPEQYAEAPSTLTVRTSSTRAVTDCRLSKGQTSWDGDPVGNGVYTFAISENGSYTLYLENTGGKISKKKINVTCFDEKYPEVTSFKIEKGKFIVNFHDGESGMDYDTLYYTSRDGKRIMPEKIDPASGLAVFPAQKGRNILHYSDLAGNECESDLEY